MSGKTTEERIDAIAKQFAREVFLWEDPFEAPSVPDEETLKKFKENFSLQDPDLDKHIRTDINCKRALDLIECDKLGIWDGFNALFQEERAEKPVEKFEKISLFVRKGDIFYTQGKLPVINENGRISFVYTFKPCAVLLLDDGEEMEWDDRVFKCAVVTSDKDGKPVEGHDIDLKNGWILHKWLRYKVSIDQLDRKRKVGAIADSGALDAITAEVTKYSVSDVQKMHFGRDERRLFAMAKYVPIMADTKKAVFEMNETIVTKLMKLMNKFKSKVEFKNPMPTPVFVGSTCDVTDTDASPMIVIKGDGEEAVCLTAKLTDPIFLSRASKADDLPTWSFSLKDVCIPEGKEFVLIDAKNENIGVNGIKNLDLIGYGLICHATDHGVAKLVEYFPEKLESDITNADQVLLVVDISE